MEISSVPKLPNHHLPTQIPWLMIPFWADHSTSDRGFFTLSESVFHVLELSECKEKLVRGSSLGWLLMLEKGPAIDLFNPITRTLIQLPPLTAFPHIKFRPSKERNEFKIDYGDETKETHNLMEMQNCFITKIVLSSSPKANSDGDEVDYTIVIILEYGKMAFMKKGDQVWTLLEGPGAYAIDIIFHKGQCFALDPKNRVVIWDFDGPSSPNLTVVSSGPQGEYCDYLVDSSGDLLLIRRILDRNCEHTMKFEVKDLGDRVLFLGPNSSVSLLAHEFSGCLRNCIYFTKNYPSNWQYFMDNDYSSEEEEDSNKIGAHDVGVFDLSS